ncbi:MAG: iron-sulfur cluster assembly accessory protein [Holosporales bacterium]|nr:iron-sulfur cluster assembly accessory protein [Holosporales bacterium]
MITVTDGALKKLRELIDEQNAKGITITAEENGCSGFQYSLSYETDSEGDGKEKKNQIVVDGISFFYESEIEPIINGLSIDIVESILGPGFTVTNKNQSTCQNCTCGRKRG